MYDKWTNPNYGNLRFSKLSWLMKSIYVHLAVGQTLINRFRATAFL